MITTHVMQLEATCGERVPFQRVPGKVADFRTVLGKLTINIKDDALGLPIPQHPDPDAERLPRT